MTDDNLPVERAETMPAEVDSMAVAMTPMQVLLNKAMDRGLDPDSMRQFISMAREQEDRERQQAYAVAMNRVQSNLQPVMVDSVNTHTGKQYASLKAVHKAVQPVYTNHGFSLSFSEAPCEAEGFKRFTCDVLHAGGHQVTRYIDLPVDDKGPTGKSNKTAVQGWISTFGYAQRVLESKIFAVVTTEDEDLDGQFAEATITEQQAADLKAQCEEVYRTPDRFLKWLEVESFAELPASKLQRASLALEEALRAKMEKAGGSE